MKKFWLSIVSFFKGEKWKKARFVVALIADMLPYVETAVTILSNLTQNKQLKAIQKALNYFNIPKEEIPFNPERTYTKSEINGILMSAANYAVRDEIQKAIEKTAEGFLIFGGQKIKNSSEIPDNIINTAVNTVYTYLKNSQGKENDE
jgi:hypothetical protein